MENDLQVELLNEKIKPVLDSIDQEELTPSEAKKMLQDEIEKLSQPSIEYKEEIDFTDQDDVQGDFQVARKVMMKALDNTNKLSDIVIEALAVDKTNPLYLGLASETNKSMQSAIKTLTDLHNSFHRLVGQKKRNEKEDVEKEDNKLPSNFVVNNPQDVYDEENEDKN